MYDNPSKRRHKPKLNNFRIASAITLPRMADRKAAAPTASQSHEAQAAQAAKSQPVRCAVLTVSDTRTAETDVGGPLIEKYLKQAGHVCAVKSIVRDEPAEIESKIAMWLDDPNIQ